MKLTQNPELLDRLAASYALGTLRGGARRRFEQLARDYAPVRAAALTWQGRWSALSEIQSPVQPDAAVWTRIDNLLQAEKAKSHRVQQRQAAASLQTAKPLAWWRGCAMAASLATVAAVSVGLWSHQDLQSTQQQLSALQSQLQTAQTALLATPEIRYVAVLGDQTGASMLVTYDPKHQQMVLQRVGHFQETQQQSLQLWALPPQGAPRSLGVIGHSKLAHIPAAETEVQAIPTLAISLEPKGGVPSATGPTGPVLFTGALIRRDL